MQEIENIARDTYENADIKIEIEDWKTYYYNSKTNDLFINNPKNPTVFQPDDNIEYLKRAIQVDIQKGGVVK